MLAYFTLPFCTEETYSSRKNQVKHPFKISLNNMFLFLGGFVESELSLPSNWTPQPANQVVQLVRIAKSSPEYLEVSRHFVAQGGRADQLHMIERIQNPQLYSMYSTFKKSMRGQVNEKRLFHGTNAANIDSINAHNFSRSFAGVNGECLFANFRIVIVIEVIF